MKKEKPEDKFKEEGRNGVFTIVISIDKLYFQGRRKITFKILSSC